MPFRPRIVKGGKSESKSCDCNAPHPTIRSYTCPCDQEKFFPDNVPDRWVCDNCSRGKHPFY